MINSITNIDDLSRFDNDGIEIFINEAGESFASINGAARMSGKAPTTIQRFTSLRNFELQQVQVDTGYGKKLVTLLNEDQIVEVLEKYNTKRLKQFAKLGIRTALHQIAGYQQEPIEEDESVEMFELDERTMELIEAWVYYRKLPSIEAAWEEYNDPDQKLEGFASPAEAAMLSDRYKAISDMAFEYLSGLWMLENRAFSDAAIEKISNRFLTPEHAAAAVEFQLELDRTQLAAAPNQKQLAEIE
jgi:hypothetical protein